MIFERASGKVFNVFNIKTPSFRSNHSTGAGSARSSQTSSLQADRPTIPETLVPFSRPLIR